MSDSTPPPPPPIPEPIPEPSQPSVPSFDASQTSAPTTPPLPPAPPGYFPVPGQVLGKRRSIGLTILLTIVTCGIWTIVWAYNNGEELKRWSGVGLGGVVHLVITFFLSPVTMFTMAHEVEQAYIRDGKQPPITTLWGLWFLLPIIGNFIWYIRIQNAINDYWTSHGQTNEPKL